MNDNKKLNDVLGQIISLIDDNKIQLVTDDGRKLVFSGVGVTSDKESRYIQYKVV